MGRSYLSARIHMFEITELISIKLGILNLHRELSDEFTFGTYRCNISRTFHGTETEFYQFSL